MKKLALAALLAFALSGCVALQKLEDIYTEVSGTTISPQQVYVTANAFDAVKVTATGYFTYCRKYVSLKTHKAFASAPVACSDDNRRGVIKYVKSGTAARDQLETYLKSGSPAPAAIFNTLKAAVDSLKASVLASGAIQ